jgi:prepilin-type N-terminal cleavage/methylation domain-containing protein
MVFIRRGFSLLELLVVVVITGVVTGLSMSKFSTYLAHERVAKAAVGIAGDINTAFAIPGRIRRPVRVRVDTSAMALLVTDRAQSTTYRTTPFGSRYNLKASNVTVYPATALEIYPNGFASDTMLITLTSNGITQRVRVSKGGTVKVEAR